MSNSVTVPARLGSTTILEQASKRLTESLAYVPPERSGAIVVVATNEGVKAAVVKRWEKGPNEWKVEAWVDKPWQGDVDYGAKILWTFR